MQLWVCVSDNFDVYLLAKSIVEAATKVKDTVTDEKSALDALRQEVSGKKYLLVLDDVWNHDVSQWEKLKSSLQYGGIGSSVLTTTRDEGIARFMGTTKYYKLHLLDESFIKEIIKTKAFSSEEETPNELVKKVGDMAKRCSGSPLAATALGSILRTKTNVEEWEAVLSRSTICDQETGILPILKLSYNDLTPQMRQCFSFCAMFPKDYKIDVKMLIQLWIANGFILEEQGVCPEIRGKQIFFELAARSFFQEVNEIPFQSDFTIESSKYKYRSRTTCKIHDLMHDVAQSAMGKECATITTEPSKSEDFPYSTRHLFVQLYQPHTILNGFLEKRAPGLQTLLCTKYEDKELQYLSKNNSIRALKIQGESSFLKPKYLHHLRYLNLSRTSVEVLPEDMSILYHLQTLDVSDCSNLAQLPKGMKYMTALRHLYTHGCEKLKMMPPELRCLISLQTLTRFVAGTTDSSCSSMGELRLLDLGGYLEIDQLENVTETDAQAANLENKKSLTELTLKWRNPSSREPQHHHKVLEGLKPHDGIKVLQIYDYGGSTYPTWISTLQYVVELTLFGCSKIEKLPPLWQLPALQVLRMAGMENLHCLCSDDHPFTCKKLKDLSLRMMPNLETWWDKNDIQVQDSVFPVVEKLEIVSCKKLPSLPRASAITTKLSGGVTNVLLSAFPALKELGLYDLTAFQRWEAVEGTLGERMTTFPWLEKLLVGGCPELTSLPEAPKLSVLQIFGGGQQIFLHVVKYITSLSTLDFSLHEGEATLPTDHTLIKLVDDKEKWNHESSSLRNVCLMQCDFLFPHSSAPALWNCFVQLEDLTIVRCDALVHWPENVFRHLVALRKLSIGGCNKLTGCTQDASDQCTTPGRSVLLPRLESLELLWCDSLVEVPALPASLRELWICRCDKLESAIVRKQQSITRPGSGDYVLIRQEESAPLRGSCSEAVAVPIDMSSSNLSPPVSLRDLTISWCDNLQSLSVQLDCTELRILNCNSLKSLDDDGHLTSLQHLNLEDRESLESIPAGPHQAYSSLRYLEIRSCPRLKVLPPCLKQRLNDIEETHLDARYTGPKLSRPSTWNMQSVGTAELGIAD